MLFERLKESFTGAIVGVVTAPFIGGILGFLIFSLTWIVQGFVSPEYNQEGVLFLAGTFGVLIAPIAAGVGVIVGTAIGLLGKLVFRARVAAASFGGFLGAFLGTLASIGLFGGEQGDLLTVFVGIFTLAFTGFTVGAIVKYVHLRLRPQEPAT